MTAESQVERKFVKRCKEKFGEDLMCIVLYGSRAKGTATEQSDWDFLVVTRGLPGKISERQKAFIGIKREILREQSETISVIPLTPEELEGRISPIIYGILTGHRVLLGEEYWKGYLDSIRPKIKDKKPIYIGDEREWNLAEIV